MAGFPKAGDEYGGRYRIVRELGHGGMGSVYEAVDQVLNRSVALKIVLPSLPDRETYQERFAREATVLARIRSRHIVGIHEYGEHEDTVFFVTELFPDGDLQSWLATNGPLDRRQALVLVAQVCEALADAHAAGVIHRDVKPGNVLLWQRSEGLIPYLADFGIATDENKKGLTRTGTLVGSPAYMAPERHFGHAADERGDIYSAGCLLWSVLAGDAPYSGTDFQMMNSHINEPTPKLGTGHAVDNEIDLLLADALQKDPERRIPTAAEMRERLLDIVSTIDGKTTPIATTTSPKPEQPPQADRTQMSVAAAPPGVTSKETAAPQAPAVGPSTSIRDLPPVPPKAGPSAAAATPTPKPDSDGNRRRTPFIVAAVLVLLLALGGTAWAIAGGGDDEPEADPTPTASPEPSETSAPAPDAPASPKAKATAAYRAVAFAITPPKATPGLEQSVEYLQGKEWKSAGTRLSVPTKQGGDKACVTLRTTVTAEDGQTASSPETKACGTSEPRTVEFIRSDDPCTNSIGGPCTFYDVRVTGFAGPASPLATVKRANGQPWCPGGCDWDAVKIGQDGRGYLKHDWKISRDEGQVILTVAGVSARFHVFY